MFSNNQSYFNPNCPMMEGYYPRPMAPMQYYPDNMGQEVHGEYEEMEGPAAPLTPKPTMQPFRPTGTGAPDFELEPGPPVTESILYTQGFLETQIGKYVKIDFLIGTNLFIDREGVLEEVGISYVVIREAGSNNPLMCDIYSIKFVEIFDQGSTRPR